MAYIGGIGTPGPPKAPDQTSDWLSIGGGSCGAGCAARILRKVSARLKSLLARLQRGRRAFELRCDRVERRGLFRRDTRRCLQRDDLRNGRRQGVQVNVQLVDLIL